MGTIKTTNIESISGSGTVTLGTSGETIALGATTNNLLTPSFKVRNNADQTLADGTWTKLTLDTEIYDTDSAFASDKFTVPSGKGGKYFISYQVSLNVTTDWRMAWGVIYVNGVLEDTLKAKISLKDNTFNDGECVMSINGVLDLSATDYVEAYGRIYSPSGGTIVAEGGSCVLQGYRII